MSQPEKNHFYQKVKNRRKYNIPEEVQAGIDAYIEFIGMNGISCCPLNAEAKEAAPVLFGKYKDAGSGNMQQGINQRDDDARYWSTMRKFNAKVFDIILKIVVPIGFAALGINKLLEWMGK